MQLSPRLLLGVDNVCEDVLIKIDDDWNMFFCSCVPDPHFGRPNLNSS